MRHTLNEDPITHKFAVIRLPWRYREGDKVPIPRTARWFGTREEALATISDLFDQDGTVTVTTIYTEERLARITRLIEQYRATKQRQRLLERAMKAWRRADANRRFADRLESPPERLH